MRKGEPYMVLSISHLLDVDWSFADELTSAHVHAFHPYPARFIPQIPAMLIEQLSEPGETILDPFCGGGTALVEATLVGRNAFGNDLNPLAALISKVKTTPLNREQLTRLESWARVLDSDLEYVTGQRTLFSPSEYTPEVLIPAIPNIDRWFEPTVKTELGMLTARIAQLEDGDLRDFCRVALSAMTVGVSNQDGETRYASHPKGIKPGETIVRFQRKLADMRSRMLEYAALREARPAVTARVLCGDTRELRGVEPGSAHLVVTSPPYPNAFDYHLYHRFRLFWLGFDPVAMAHGEIGSHLNYQRNGENMRAFIRDMTACFSRINWALAMGRYCCVVIGDSVFKGELVKNDEVTIQIAEGCGFVLEQNIKRSLHRVKRSFATPARRLKEESIVVLRKVGDVDPRGPQCDAAEGNEADV